MVNKNKVVLFSLILQQYDAQSSVSKDLFGRNGGAVLLLRKSFNATTDFLKHFFTSCVVGR